MFIRLKTNPTTGFDYTWEIAEGSKGTINLEDTVEEFDEFIKPTVIVEPKLAVGYIPPAIDEKQAGRLERYLLESDPNLKRGEAKFYARHCTLGMIYTIAQYKKAIGCVYETARTSMDHLAELGYYKKDLF